MFTCSIVYLIDKLSSTIVYRFFHATNLNEMHSVANILSYF